MVSFTLDCEKEIRVKNKSTGYNLFIINWFVWLGFIKIRKSGEFLTAFELYKEHFYCGQITFTSVLLLLWCSASEHSTPSAQRLRSLDSPYPLPVNLALAIP